MEIQREVIDIDVLIVGAGPAGLACAYHLAKQSSANGLTPEILVIEKASAVGEHSLSGAIMDVRAIAELMPDFLAQGMPYEKKAGKERFVYLSAGKSVTAPMVPPGMHNDGNYIISLNKFTAWLAGKVEALGVNILTGAGGYELLIEEGTVVGVRTVDMGCDKDGSPRSNFTPGSILKAKVTILAEGPRGSLTKQAYGKLNIGQGRAEHSYLTGIKEIWQVPSGRLAEGEIIHTFGWPQESREFGGAFIYEMAENTVSLGFCSALNSPNPTNDPHMKFQRFKTHPFVKRILEGGKVVRYGAKVIAEGGYYAIPKLFSSGLLLCGESAGMLNAQRLKGVHLAIKTGMLAAEATTAALAKNDFSEATLAHYDTLFQDSWAKRELFAIRNFHAGFEDGLWAGMMHAGAQFLTGGRGLFDRRHTKRDSDHMMTITEYRAKFGRNPEKEVVPFDGKLTFDKLTDVYHSGTMHDEHQPAHLVISDYDICNNRCTVEYGNPCQHFCPASVYNMVNDEGRPGKQKLQLTPSNCVHCKTCDIADPYQIITWVTPEAGGPNYVGM